MKYIELFAGIGGFRYGLSQVDSQTSGLETEGRTTERILQDSTDTEKSTRGHRAFTCVYANEWDKYAAQIYRRHYGEIDTRDIRDVSEFPDFDLLTAGFPCQAFSVAGKRLGFEDTRGTLFFEIARILKSKRPRHLLLENVKGLLSHEEGKTFQTILGVLSDLGYRVEWVVLNSKHFGVPQNRERVFIIGHLRGECTGEVFPVRQPSEVANEGDAEIAATLQSPGHACGNYKGMNMIIQRPHGFHKGGETELPSLRGSAMQYNDFLKSDKIIRRLTPVECERLQGFPDGWTEGVSDTQRYKCLGNAVTTNAITAIGEGLLQHIEDQGDI